MTTSELIDEIQKQKCIFEMNSYPKKDLAICISFQNAKKIVDYHSEITGKKINLISEIYIFGMRVFPSEFMSENDLGIFELKQMKYEKNN
jgi:hypothetical protein